MPLSLLPIDAQAILESVAAVVEVFEVQRRAVGGMGQALDAHDRRALLDRQGAGQVGIGEHRVDGQVGMAEGNAAIVLEDQEDVAGHQVGLLQALAERLRQVGDFQRNRLAVDQAHPLDLAHRAALFHPQALGHLRAGRQVAQAVQAVDDLVAHLRHGLAQALQGADVLERLRSGDEGALAVDLEDQPFLLQVAERLAHGDAADVEGLAQLVLRRHAAERRVDAVEDAPAQQLLELAVQRHGRKREQFAHGRIRSSEWLGHLL